MSVVTPPLETNPRTYYQYYKTAPPSYDLYPSLSRRLGNGYEHQPSPPVRRHPRTANIFTMNVCPPNPSSHELPAWDLYPSILRSVENFGTDQMRQQLHAMETTT
ncbi:hypothetical protein DM01DRAFT_1411862 [Hesseltinella vesiculosa]|uniref:Uncharacterized protein n=1 Tax=Hesseltinella vesiculosa TaxID=101127 RepID=A0A1X2G222_9FUNG|nr:hypothetical protein DM01DRAFT_1411862 [Hesseltinella vesiculosa]